MPYDMKIVSSPWITVTSLHPSIGQVRSSKFNVIGGKLFLFGWKHRPIN